MSSAGIFFITIACVPIVLIIINITLYYTWLHKTSYAVITYKDFKSMFNIAPNKWNYFDTYIEYCNTSMYINTIHGLWRAKYDICKYRNGVAKTESLRKKQQLIKQWQKDIEEYKQKAINDASEQLKETGILNFTNEQKSFIKDAILQYCRTAEIKDAKEYSSMMEFAEKYANSLTINNVASGKLN